MSSLLRPDFERRFAAAAVLFAAAGCLPAAGAAETEQRQDYDLAADVASRTLQEFAEQAGTEVVFSTATARIRTNAVRGRFTPEEAIARLLHGTGLVAERSARTGAFTVMRAPAAAPPPARPNPPPAPNSPKHTDSESDDMKSHTAKPRKLTSLLAGLLAIVASPGEAQTVPPPASSATQEEALMLSPFTVQSERDTGYQATSTLAGTRLNTPLKDLGASISIYTKDFLEDIAATNSNDLLIYAVGMEAAGPGGNFSGATNDINATDVVAQGPRTDPQSGTRTRGLAKPTFSRGYFLSEIGLDSYNTESVTVNRGPNAILFGVGSPAGVVEQALARANLQRNRNKLEVRYGNNDSLRSTIDLNRVLVRGKLALRVAALYDREEFNQRPAYDFKKRVYGALNFEPFKTTAVRVNFESGRTRGNRPLTILPADSVSEWMAAGRPGYDWSFYDDPARNPNAATQVAGPGQPGPWFQQVPFSQNGVIIYEQPRAQVPTLSFNGVTRSTAANAADSVKNQLLQPLVNRDRAADTINFVASRNLFELPASYWTGANVLPGQQPGEKPAGIKTQGFTDFSVFDFKNHMIDESSRQRESFNAFNIALEQRAWKDRVGVELAYDTQRFHRRIKNSVLAESSTNHIRVDTSETLPTGEPNPNYGRPFAESQGANFPTRFNRREAMRATGFLRYDFKDLERPWAKWLGRHTLTGLYEENTIDTITYNNLYASDGAAAISQSPTINQRRPAIVAYLGPSLIGNNNPLQLQAAAIPEIKEGPLGVNTRYFVRAANATDPGHFEDAPASLTETLAAANANRELIKSQAAVLQSYWLSDHLITLVGWRRDEDYFFNKNFNLPVANPANLDDPGKTQAGFDEFSFPSTPPSNASGEVKTYSAVLRWPRRLIRLPEGTDVSLSYNHSSNFTPAGGRYDAFGGSLPSPEGETKEYGVALSAFHDKLTVRVNHFETSVKGQSFSPSAFQNAQWFGLGATAGVWAEEGNANPHLEAMRNADIDLLFSALPPDYKTNLHYEVMGTSPNISATVARISGAADTTDYVAKGTELELVYNPTRNWRILANVARQETILSNMLPGTKDLIARMKPIWDKLADRPKGNYPLGWQPGDPLPGNVQTYGDWLDQNVYIPFATTVATEGVASAEQRKWRANLVTNYTFSRDVFGGQLKGWGLGGAVRWQDKLGLGYPTGRNPDSSGTIDLAHPYYAPAETNVDAWVSYQRKLWHDRIDWKIQFNVRNLYGGDDVIPIGVQPWGEVATVRLAPERRWYVTNTFSF